MGHVFRFRRLAWGPPRVLPAPQFLRRLGGSRFLGLVAIAAFVGGMLQFKLQLLPANVDDTVWHGLLDTAHGIGMAAIDKSEPDQPAAIRARPSITVVDGDTVRSGGETYRLVGIDTPETKPRAKCNGEHERATRAKERLRELVGNGDTDLTRVPCACRSGTEGTSACNYGRLCGVLRVHGRDVADTLVSERLARRYACGSTVCPPRGSWCW
jgi:endonuclease YncB( thermonuclease family)